jgi:hypothetical protein
MTSPETGEQEESPGIGANPGPPRTFTMANSIGPAVVRITDDAPETDSGSATFRIGLF